MSMNQEMRFLPGKFADRLRALRLAVRRPVRGTVQGRHRSSSLGASVEFAEYRAYAPGDPVQLLDWAVYARSDRHVIRRHREETNLRGWILLDVSKSMDFRDEANERKFDYACRLAAALMFILVNQGDSVGLIPFNGGAGVRFGPASTLTDLRPLLEALEGLRPAGVTRFETAIREAAALMPRRGLVLLLSDLLDPPERITRGLHLLRHEGHDVTVFQVLDPGELHLAAGSVTEYRELETGRRLTVDPDELRDRYSRAVRRHIEQLRRGCSDAQSDYRLAVTSEPLEALLHTRTSRKM